MLFWTEASWISRESWVCLDFTRDGRGGHSCGDGPFVCLIFFLSEVGQTVLLGLPTYSQTSQLDFKTWGQKFYLVLSYLLTHEVSPTHNRICLPLQLVVIRAQVWPNILFGHIYSYVYILIHILFPTKDLVQLLMWINKKIMVEL